MRAWVPSLVRVGVLTGVFLLLGSTLVPPVMSQALPMVVVIPWEAIVTSVIAAVITEGVIQGLAWVFRRASK